MIFACVATAMSVLYATQLRDSFFIGEGLKDMATEKVDDGPAFPMAYKRVDTGVQVVHNGMWLRDFFAAHTVAALADTDLDPVKAAERAYRIADAMLKERAK